MSAQEQRSPVSYRKFEPRNLLPEGLLGVERSSGEVEAALARRFASLAGTFSANADTAAAGEGRRAGLVAGNQDGFRPTRADTIRGQAYDAAGTRSYMARLETGLRSDLQQAYMANENNPAGFEQAAAALRRSYHDDHLFPEIKGDFDAGFSRLADAYWKQAADNARADERDRQTAELYGQINDQGTHLERVIQSTDPGSEAGAALVSDAVRATEASIDAAVTAGTISATRGEALKTDARRKAAVSYYVRQGQQLGGAEAIGDYLEKLRGDFAGGQLDLIDGDAFARIETGLEAEIRKAQTQDGKRAREIRAKGKFLSGQIALGVKPDEAQIRELVLAAGSSEEGDEAAQEALDRVTLARFFADSTLEAGEAFVRGMEEKARKGASKRDAEALGWARQLMDAKRKFVIENPLGAARAYGVDVEAAPLAIEQGKPAEQYAAEFAARILEAETAAAHWQVAPRLLLPGEDRQIANLLRTDPMQAAAVAGGLFEAAGDHLPRLLRELGSAAPEVAQMGRIIASGGSEIAAIDVLRGRSKDGDGRVRPRVPASVRNTQAVTGSAFVASPDDQELVLGAAENIARARIAEQGIDPADKEAVQPVYEQALQEAAGRTVHEGVAYGGITRWRTGWFDGKAREVVVPANMAADLFGDAIEAIRPEDLQQLALNERYRISDLRKALPIAVPGGYMFAKGDPMSDDPQLLEGRDGRPAVIDFDALRPLLEPRVPGLYRQ